MGRPKVIHQCAGCGADTPRRGRATDGVRCIDCSIQRHIDAVVQIRAGFGEHYDKWLAGMQRAITRRQTSTVHDGSVLDNDPHAQQ